LSKEKFKLLKKLKEARNRHINKWKEDEALIYECLEYIIKRM